MLPFNLRLKTFYILIRICKTFCEWGIYKYAKYEISWGHMRLFTGETGGCLSDMKIDEWYWPEKCNYVD